MSVCAAEMSAPAAMSESWAVLSPESLKERMALTSTAPQEPTAPELSACSETTETDGDLQGDSPKNRQTTAAAAQDADHGTAVPDGAPQGVSDGWCWVVQGSGQSSNSTPPTKARNAAQGRAERMQQILATTEKRIGELEGCTATRAGSQRTVTELKELSRHLQDVAAEALEYVASHSMPEAMEIYERSKADLEKSTTLLRQCEEAALVPRDQIVVATTADQSLVLAARAGGVAGDKAASPTSADGSANHSIADAVMGLLTAVMCGCFSGVASLAKGSGEKSDDSGTSVPPAKVVTEADKHVGGA